MHRFAVLVGDIGGRKTAIHIVVIMHGDAELLEIAQTSHFRRPLGTSLSLYRRKDEQDSYNNSQPHEKYNATDRRLL
jgi:glucokinase